MQPEQQPIKTSDKPLIVFNAYVNGVKHQAHMDHEKLTISGTVIKNIDMLGLVLKSQDADNQYSYSLYSYPKIKKAFKSEKRYVQEFKFEIRDEKNWRQTEKQIIYRINNRDLDQPLKLLICFNPNAGANSRKHLQNTLNFIHYTNLQIQVLETNGRHHCLDHLRKFDHTQYCGVAIVSGDGLIHQFVNSFCQIPVIHVPAGSGNAFAKTQMEEAGQLCKDEESIYLVVKNRPKKFNLIKYELQKHNEPIYSFLSLEWAIIADLDMNSEHLRFLGGLRFQIYAVWLIFKMKRYRGRLTYSTIQQQIPSFDTDLTTNPNYITIQDTFLHSIFCAIPYISDKFKIAPLLKQEQKFIDMQTLNEEAGRIQLAKYLISADSGSQFNLENKLPADGFKFKHNKIKSFRLEPLDPNQPGIFGIDGQSYESQRIQGSFSEKTFLAFV